MRYCLSKFERGEGHAVHIELAVLDFIQEHLRTVFGDVAFPLVTSLGNVGAVWILLGVVLLAFRRTRRYGVAVLLALAVEALICNLALKPLVARTRPFDVNTTVELLINRPQDFSFPSGHTSAGFATAAALYATRCKGWAAAGVLAVVIAFSRLYLYVHFPTDVLAGAALGIICGLVIGHITPMLCTRADSTLARLRKN